MSQLLNASIIQASPYFYERLPYTGFPFAGAGGASSLPLGQTNLFQTQPIAGWNGSPGTTTTQLRLERISGTQRTDVRFRTSVDPGSVIPRTPDGVLSALPLYMRPLPLYLPAVSEMGLTLENSGTAAIAGFQFNYAMGMKRLTGVDKLLAQRTGLPQYELSAHEKLALTELRLAKQSGSLKPAGESLLKLRISQGTQPVGLEHWLQALYDPRVLQAPADLYLPTATSSDTVFATYQARMHPTRPSEGRFLILTGIGIEGNPLPNITLSVDRDGQSNRLDIEGAAAGLGTEYYSFCPFLVSTDTLTFHINRGPGNVLDTPASIRLQVVEAQMSDIIAIQLGKVTNPQQVRGDLYWRVIAGVMG